MTTDWPLLTQVANQNLEADDHKDEAADEFGPDTSADALAKPYAQQVAHETEKQRGEADDGQWEREIGECMIAREGEGNTDG